MLIELLQLKTDHRNLTRCTRAWMMTRQKSTTESEVKTNVNNLLPELLRIFEQLSTKAKSDLLTYARRLLVNQDIKRNRKA